MCAPLPINRFCFPCHADEHNDNRDKREGVEIEFLSNGIKFAEAERAPYRATYTPPQAGLYTLTARIHYGEGHRFIESNTINVVSDLPPTIALTGPANNTVQTAPASFALAATAGSQFGTIAKVEFYSGATLVGTATAGAGNAYSFTWSNVPYGTYSLTAKATDNYGFSSTTAAISVISNAPPSVSITNPADKTVLKTPANNTALTTDAADVDGTIAKVEFYAATTDANGVTTNTLVGTVTQSPYSYQWNAIPIGQYVLTTIATDNYGAQTTSSPVALTVKPGELLPYYIHTDHLDTPREITDTGGNVVWQWDNADPFGNNVPNGNPSGLGKFEQPLRFSGQYADKETNLYYNINRNYDPMNGGRYIESDLIGLQGGINTYTYVGGNPISFIDPFGLDVTVSVFSGENGNRAGHIALGVNTSSTIGLAPAPGVSLLKIILDQPVPAIMEPTASGRKPESTITIHTSPQQDRLIQNFINQKKKNPGSYRITGSNCATTVHDALKTGGINSPDTMWPRDLMQGLQQSQNSH